MIRFGIECESIEIDMWGVARAVRQLLTELASRPELQNEFRVYLYYKNRLPDWEFLNSPIFTKVRVPVPFFPHRFFPIYQFLLLPLRLWWDRLDAMFWPNYMLPLFTFTKSIIMTTDDVFVEMRSKAIPVRYRIAYLMYAQYAAFRGSKLMTISDTSKKEILRMYPEIPDSRIVVNHHAISITDVSPAFAPVPYPYILYIGQTFPRRHAKETMLAFEQIASEFSDLHLVLIATDRYSPPQIGRLRDEINGRLGFERIQWLPFASDTELARYYTHATAVVYVSSREAFGLPPLEAIALGSIPVVADTDISHELLGTAGFFVSGKDTYTPEAIAATLRDALTNTGHREYTKGQSSRIAQQFSRKNFTDRFLNIVRDVSHAY